MTSKQHNNQGIFWRRRLGAGVLYCATLLLVSFSLTNAAQRQVDDSVIQISEAILATFTSSLYTLPPAIQRHFCVRMYRITGNERYIYPIVFDLLLTVEELRQDVAHLDDSAYLMRKTALLLNEFNIKTRKGKMRRRVLTKRGSLIFYLRLLYNVSKVAEYRLDSLEINLLSDKIYSRLQKMDFSAYLLDREVVRVYAPQAVNYVYYLCDLDIVDLRAAYVSAFRKTFPDDDENLSVPEYRDKIYGLTHFILAASRYYQFPVDSAQFEWILEYFDRNIDLILQRGTADIVAEVGICFLLAGVDGHSIVSRCREFILSRFDETNNMLLSPRGNNDLVQGEHRNILAYLLLNWPDSLVPGPYLDRLATYRQLESRTK